MMRAAILLILLLAGCSGEPAAENRAAPVESPAPSPSPSATPFAPPTDRLPRSLLGTWTADASGACTPGTELRIVVEPARVRFYESEARISAVGQVDPHSWRVDANVTGEGETRSIRFTLNLNEDGTLTRVQAPIPDITYSRCKA